MNTRHEPLAAATHHPIVAALATLVCSALLTVAAIGGTVMLAALR